MTLAIQNNRDVKQRLYLSQDYHKMLILSQVRSPEDYEFITNKRRDKYYMRHGWDRKCRDTFYPGIEMVY